MICPNCGSNKLVRNHTRNFGSVRVAEALCTSCGSRYKALTALIDSNDRASLFSRLYALLRGPVELRLRVVGQAATQDGRVHSALDDFEVPLEQYGIENTELDP